MMRPMKVSRFVAIAVFIAAAAVVQAQHASAPAPRPPARPKKFTVVETSISDMRKAMAAGRVTSHQIVAEYLERFALYEDTLHAALAVNRNALAEADALDRERRAGHIRGPLHGIPIAVKDNIHTLNM